MKQNKQHKIIGYLKYFLNYHKDVFEFQIHKAKSFFDKLVSLSDVKLHNFYNFFFSFLPKSIILLQTFNF